MIDQASVFAERFRSNPQILQATVLGQGNVPGLDPYTALNALKLIKESNMMAMAGRAQQPTSSPSIVAETLAPAPSPQGLGAMVPNTMGQMPPGAPQGLAAMAPQQRAPVMQRSGGLAGMPTPEEDYAEGGIVAFNGQTGSAVRDPEATAVADDPLSRLLAEAGVTQPTADDTTTEGNPAMRDEAFQNYLESRREIQGLKDEDFTPEEAKKYRQEYYDFSRANAGPDIYAPANKRLTERENARSKSKSQGEGLALLAAAGAILEGNTLARGASKAFPVFAKEMGEVQRADINEQRSIESMQFALADAQRKERMGDIRGAQAAMETARKAKSDANRFKLNKAVALGTLDSKALQSLRPAGKGASSGDASTKLPQVDRDAAAITKQIIALEEKDPNDPRIASLKKQRQGLLEIIGVTKDVGPNKLGAQNTQIFVGAAKDSSAEARKMLYTDPVMRSNDRTAISNRYKELYAESIQRRFPGTPLSDLLANMPAEDLGSVAAPTAGKPAAQKALPMPASKDDLKTNQLYNTSQGLAIWNGKSFVAQ